MGVASPRLIPPLAESQGEAREREAASVVQSRGASWPRAGLPGRNVPRELQRAGWLPGGGGIGLGGRGGKCQRWWALPEVCENSQGAPYLGRELSAALQVERDPQEAEVGVSWRWEGAGWHSPVGGLSASLFLGGGGSLGSRWADLPAACTS